MLPASGCTARDTAPRHICELPHSAIFRQYQAAHFLEDSADMSVWHVAGDVSGGRGCRGPRGSERGCGPLVAASTTAATATATATTANESLSFHLNCRGGQPVDISLPCVAPRPMARFEQRVHGRGAAPSPPAGAAQQRNWTAAAWTTPSSAPMRPSDLLQHLLPKSVTQGKHVACTDTRLKFISHLHYQLCFQNSLYTIYFLFIF